jgi:hypothetical protein
VAGGLCGRAKGRDGVGGIGRTASKSEIAGRYDFRSLKLKALGAGEYPLPHPAPIQMRQTYVTHVFGFFVTMSPVAQIHFKQEPPSPNIGSNQNGTH